MHEKAYERVPAEGFLRDIQIVGDKKSGIPPILPIGRSTWWKGVREGRYPKPVKLGPRMTLWRAADIRRLLERISEGKPGAF